MSFIYHTFFFDPLYNTLVILFKILPWADAGVIIIILTILVRLIIFPLSKKAVLTQVRMAAIAPDLAKIKEQYKNNTEEQARRTLALYKEKGVNPFSGIFVIIIQIPIILALYQIFLYFPKVDMSLLYSFVPAPEFTSTTFLVFLNITTKKGGTCIFRRRYKRIQKRHINFREIKKNLIEGENDWNLNNNNENARKRINSFFSIKSEGALRLFFGVIFILFFNFGQIRSNRRHPYLGKNRLFRKRKYD